LIKKIALAAIILGAVFIAYNVIPKAEPFVKGTFYDEATIMGAKVYLDYGFLNEKKLVFIDVQLKDKAGDINFQNRVIPLRLYKDGAYIPLMAELTPSGKVVVALRVCEPCGSFSFHIEESRYIACDLCGTRWDVETLSGVSGGCANYPPPRLDGSLNGDSIEIDLSTLGLQLVS